MKKALFYENFNDLIQCKLCTHFCKISESKTGFCNARKNINGTLYSQNYGQITSIAVDPIEKKPLYHFFPSSKILSVGSYGCNMRCLFCQNHTISQGKPKTDYISPKKLFETALLIPKNLGIAFTYNEPLISFEYLIDCARIFKKTKLKVVVISNGIINPEPLKILLPLVDAFNIDLKSFNSNFYRKHVGNLETVKLSIEKIFKNCHLEITTLVIPNENDSEAEILKLATWISNLSDEIPLHLSRFFPRNKMFDLMPTPVEKLYKLAKIAKRSLKYVYIGNI